MVLANLALPEPALPEEQTCHAAVECAAVTKVAAMKMAMDLAVEKMLAELAASCAAILAVFASAAAKAMALAVLALAEKTHHSIALRTVLARSSFTDEHCCWKLVQRAAALAAKASTNNKEAAGRFQNLPTAHMAMRVFVADTHRPEMPDAAPDWVVAKLVTALVLPLLDNEA
jgi:hypothetical protein